MSLEGIVANLVQKVEHRFYGKYRGFVVENADPEHLGRLKVTVPGVLGDRIAVWAFPCLPYGGNPNRGLLFIPEMEAGVWVEFEEGDPEFPIWVGTFWSKPGGQSELPRPNHGDGAEPGAVQDPPTRKIIKTQKGHTIQFEDADGEESVTIVEAANGHVITLDRNGITVSDGVGNNRVIMESGGITVKSGRVKIGEGASEALVLGDSFKASLDNFMEVLKTHTHTCTLPPNGTSGLPSSPFTLKLPLSTNHKVE